MIVVPEAACPSLLSLDDAFAPVEQVFAAMARGDAGNFPVVREALGGAEEALYGFKGGYDRAGATLGLKAGGYWPHNLVRRGITNHQSTVFLFDPLTGRPTAMIGGNYLTAARTAAAAAVSVRHLARQDAKVLGMIGAGHQAAFQLRAALRQRPFERVVGWNRNPAALSRLADVANEAGLPFTPVTLDDLGSAADVIISITSSFAPILMAAQVKPGTHLACMGTDTRGKQEVEAALLARATVFTDEVAQSVSIGEAQHAVAAGLIDSSAITPIGAVINGTHPGRTAADEITLFDGTGVGLQDLAVAARVVALATAAGKATSVDF